MRLGEAEEKIKVLHSGREDELWEPEGAESPSPLLTSVFSLFPHCQR